MFCIKMIRGKVRVFFIENREDFLRMGVILCKDDRLAQFIAIVDGQTVGHQCIQYLSDGIFIEDPFVQRRGRNALRGGPSAYGVLAPLCGGRYGKGKLCGFTCPFLSGDWRRLYKNDV